MPTLYAYNTLFNILQLNDLVIIVLWLANGNFKLNTYCSRIVILPYLYVFICRYPHFNTSPEHYRIYFLSTLPSRNSITFITPVYRTFYSKIAFHIREILFHEQIEIFMNSDQIFRCAKTIFYT